MNDLAFIEDVEREMRSALGAVLGFAEMLATDGHEQLSEKQQRWVELMLQNGHLLQEYVEGSFVLTRRTARRSRGGERLRGLDGPVRTTRSGASPIPSSLQQTRVCSPRRTARRPRGGPCVRR